MSVDQVAVFASIPSHIEDGDGSRWGDNLLSRHPPRSQTKLYNGRESHLPSNGGWGIKIIFHYPTPNEKPNEMLVHDLDSAAPSCGIAETNAKININFNGESFFLVHPFFSIPSSE
jgi:hypothetical protein